MIFGRIIGRGRKLLKKKELAGSKGKSGPKQPISTSLKKNLDVIRQEMDSAPDVVIRPFIAGGREMAIVFIDGMINDTIINRDLLPVLMTFLPPDQGGAIEPTFIREKILSIDEVDITSDLMEMLSTILDGKVGLLAEGWSRGLTISAQGFEKRAIAEPQTEAVVRGPREGFTENLLTNTTLIRRKIRSTKLRVKSRRLGRLTNTMVSVIYLEGIAPQQVLDELKRRLDRIDIDGVLESGYIQELTEDAPFSPFPQHMITERPDVAARKILEGYVAILTDGTPFALIVPGNFPCFIHSPEDYYERWGVSLGIRTFRLMGLLISLLLPSLYVALTTFHQEMLPTPLAVSLAAQRARVPYPAFIEALFMQIVFEILVEAGLRLPRPMGQAIGIVGALVIGEAAVRAGLISASMVIVIALTAISSFVVPTFSFSIAIRMLRLPMIFLAAALGIFGIFTGFLMILIHLVTLRSFGLPYLSPITPFIWPDHKDVLVRSHWWALVTRPVLPGFRNWWRAKPGINSPFTQYKRRTSGELEQVLGNGRPPSPPKKGGGSRKLK